MLNKFSEPHQKSINHAQAQGKPIPESRLAGDRLPGVILLDNDTEDVLKVCSQPRGILPLSVGFAPAIPRLPESLPT